MVVVDSMAAITDTVADVTGFIDVSESIIVRLRWYTRKLYEKVEMSSQVVKLNLDCLELDKGGHGGCSLGFNSLG